MPEVEDKVRELCSHRSTDKMVEELNGTTMIDGGIKHHNSACLRLGNRCSSRWKRPH